MVFLGLENSIELIRLQIRRLEAWVPVYEVQKRCSQSVVRWTILCGYDGPGCRPAPSEETLHFYQIVFPRAGSRGSTQGGGQVLRSPESWTPASVQKYVSSDLLYFFRAMTWPLQRWVFPVVFIKISLSLGLCEGHLSDDFGPLLIFKVPPR